MKPSGCTFRALGTSAAVLTVELSDLADALRAVRAEIRAVDEACSRFRPDSELSAVNRAGGACVRVGAVLCAALAAALRAARLTDGDVDPTVGGALAMLGYDRDFADLSSGPAVGVVRVPGWERVELDIESSTVRVPEGAMLDLGATGKAVAADCAAAAAADATGRGVLVSLGGDVAVAGPPPPGGWTVRVADSHDAPLDAPGQIIELNGGALATSSTTVRRWLRGGDEVHHVIDPHTGAPAQVRWRTVSVAAATCVDANTASTAAIVRGDRAVGWLEALGLPARLVRPDGTVVTVAGWPEDAE